MNSRIFKTGMAAVLFAAFSFILFLGSCQDDVSNVGGSLAGNEVTITVDSLAMQIEHSTVYEPVYNARSTTKLLGRISVPQYGDLDCSFVTELMCATKMGIPDSITVNDIDSMRLMLSVPRGSLTGDSLAPQQLKVFRLTKRLPADITNEFDPAGYYDPSRPLGVRSYTLSAIASGDTAFMQDQYIRIPVMMPKKFATDSFEAYRNNNPIFQWPQSFAQAFPGLYIEQNFGNGCVGSITGVQAFTYWHRTEMRYEKDPDSETGAYHYVPYTVRDSVCLFASQPEVISSNMIKFRISESIRKLVAEKKSVVTTPGGYYVKIKFPARQIIEKYKDELYRLSVVSRLSFQIPGHEIKNDFGIGVVPTLLMVKTSEREKFFNENKIPDGKTSFTATYNATTGTYSFNNLRDYIISMIDKGEGITEDDIDFSLVPVVISTEDVSSYYGNSTTYVTRCAPYIGRPTMTLLDLDKTVVAFTFSSQIID